MTEPARDSSPAADTPFAAQERADRLKAIGLMTIAVSLFGLLDATGKYLVGPAGLPVAQVVAMRFLTNVLFALLAFPFVFGWRALPRIARARRPMHQLVRSFFMFGATIFNFMAVRYLQLDQTITIFYATPLLVALLAGPLLGEWVRWRRMLAIMVGFFGVLLVTRPGFGGIHWAVVFSICAMVCYALYNISTRYLARYDTTETTLFYSPVVGCVLTLPFIAFDWHWPQDALTWVLLFAIGLVGGIGHWLLIAAHRSAPAPVLAPFIYTNIVTIVLLGYLIFGDLPNLWTLTGGAIVIASGLYIFYREQQVGRHGR